MDRRRFDGAILPSFAKAAYQSGTFQPCRASGHRDHALLDAVPAIARKRRRSAALAALEKCVCSD